MVSLSSFVALLLVAMTPLVLADPASPCEWSGTAPFCKGSCGGGLPVTLTIGSGGSGNGKHCSTGIKALCCPRNYPWKNCAWSGTGPACKGACDSGQVQIASDDSGDGSYCVTGKKVYCCDKPEGLELDDEDTSEDLILGTLGRILQNEAVL